MNVSKEQRKDMEAINVGVNGLIVHVLDHEKEFDVEVSEEIVDFLKLKLRAAKK